MGIYSKYLIINKSIFLFFFIIIYLMNTFIDMKQFIFIDQNLCLSLNIKFFRKQKNYEEFIKYIFNVIDNILLIRKKKLNLDTINVLVDLKDYKLKEIDYDFIKLMIHVCEEKYPDNLNIINIKNANIMVKTIYSFLRPFIHKDTRKKIFFIKKNKKKGKKEKEKEKEEQNSQINEENIDDLFDV